MNIYNCYFEMEYMAYDRLRTKLVREKNVIATSKRDAYFKALRKGIGKGYEDEDVRLSWIHKQCFYELSDNYTLETAITEVAEDVYMRFHGAVELPLVIYM